MSPVSAVSRAPGGGSDVVRMGEESESRYYSGTKFNIETRLYVDKVAVA